MAFSLYIVRKIAICPTNGQVLYQIELLVKWSTLAAFDPWVV